jgi:hypothetical protein
MLWLLYREYKIYSVSMVVIIVTLVSIIPSAVFTKEFAMFYHSPFRLYWNDIIEIRKRKFLSFYFLTLKGPRSKAILTLDPSEFERVLNFIRGLDSEKIDRLLNEES